MFTGPLSVVHGHRRIANYTSENCPAEALLNCSLAFLPSPTPDPLEWEQLVKRELQARGKWLHGSVKSALEHIDPLLVELSCREHIAPSLDRLVQAFVTVLGFRLVSDSALRAKIMGMQGGRSVVERADRRLHQIRAANIAPATHASVFWPGTDMQDQATNANPLAPVDAFANVQQSDQQNIGMPSATAWSADFGLSGIFEDDACFDDLDVLSPMTLPDTGQHSQIWCDGLHRSFQSESGLAQMMEEQELMRSQGHVRLQEAIPETDQHINDDIPVDLTNRLPDQDFVNILQATDALGPAASLSCQMSDVPQVEHIPDEIESHPRFSLGLPRIRTEMHPIAPRLTTVSSQSITERALSPRPSSVMLRAPPPTPASGPAMPIPHGWAGRPLSALMPRAFAACMKFTGLAAPHEAALAAQYRTVLRACFEGQLGMSPGFQVALGHCIGVCMDARQVSRSVALELAGTLQALGGGQVWMQLPSGETLSSSGTAAALSTPSTLFVGTASVVAVRAIGNGGRALQVTGTNLISGDAPIADIWAWPRQTAHCSGDHFSTPICLDVVSSVAATKAGDLDTLHLLMPQAEHRLSEQVQLSALRPQHVIDQAVISLVNR